MEQYIIDNDDLAIKAKEIPEKIAGMDKEKEKKLIEHRIDG